jgi:hypothetical protein
MNTPPEALRLADILVGDAYWSPMLGEKAAAELRRLHALCDEQQSELFAYRASEYLKDVTAALKAKREANS